MKESQQSVRERRGEERRGEERRGRTSGLVPKMLLTQPPKMASSGCALASVGPVRSEQHVCQMRGKPQRARATRVVVATTRAGRRGALASASALALALALSVARSASRSNSARHWQLLLVALVQCVSSSQQSPSASSRAAKPPYSSSEQSRGRLSLHRAWRSSPGATPTPTSCESSVSVAHERGDGPDAPSNSSLPVQSSFPIQRSYARVPLPLQIGRASCRERVCQYV